MELDWDRGTLLVGDVVEPGVAGVRWDPRVGRWRAPAHLYGELLTASSRVVDRVRQAGCEPSPMPVPPLREYQTAALSAWELAGRRGVISLPTGAGKTRTAIAAIARTRVSTLCLVPTRVLLEQWVAALGAAGAQGIGRFGDGERQLGAITVSTYASAAANVTLLGNRFDLLIVDEAHHFGAGRGDECLELSIARFRLGLTATPGDGGERGARCAQLIGPVVFHTAIEELAGRFLASFALMTMTLPLDRDERATYAREVAVWRPVVKRFFALAPGATWSDFVVTAGRSEEGRRALAAWRRARALAAFTRAKREALSRLLVRHAGGRVLIFAADAATVYGISRSHLVPCLTADIGRPERAELLARFGRGALKVLASARVLNEGVDVPEAEVAIVVAGTQGPREFVQRAGRVLRPSAGKQALIYELLAGGTHEVREAERRRSALGGAH